MRHRELDLTGVNLTGLVVSTQGRLWADTLALQHGWPKVSVTRARTPFSWVYVLQQDSPDNVVEHVAHLLTEAGTVRRIELPIYGSAASGREPRIPLADLCRALAAVEADYPAGSVTRALAEALGNVVGLWAAVRRAGWPAHLDLRSVDEAIGEPLRRLVAAWSAKED